MTKRTIVGDIEGGLAPAELLPDDNLTIEHLWATYRWYPGFAEMHDLQVQAIWANGITDENIEQDRIHELKRGHVFAYLCGYVAYVVDTNTNPPSITAWNPTMDGIGFRITEFSDFGYPTQIAIQAGVNENNKPIEYFVSNYPVETVDREIGQDVNGDPIMGDYHIRTRPEPKGFGFFIVRNSRGRNGVRGLPEYLSLVHAIRAQNDILNAYTPYAKKQGMAFPAVYLENNTKAKRAEVKTQFANQPQTNRLLILSNDDLVEWISPQANAYDPFPILQWVDQLISRRTQMNTLMLSGMPVGGDQRSSTAIANWVKQIKEQQVFWRSEFQPIWEVLGASKEAGFNDPSEPAFLDLMDGLKALREALVDIVPNEDIVKLANEFLKQQGKDWNLHAISNEEMKENTNMMGGMDQKDGDIRSGGDNGSKPKQEA